MSHGECPHSKHHNCYDSWFAYKGEHSNLCSAAVVAPEKALPVARHCKASTPGPRAAQLCNGRCIALSHDAPHTHTTDMSVMSFPACHL